jgi:tyrosinase
VLSPFTQQRAKEMNTTRRTFLSLVSSGVVLGGATVGEATTGVSAAAVPMNSAVRTRKSVTSLDENSAEIKAFKKAVSIMKGQIPQANGNILPAADPRSWRKQAEIHGAILGSFGRCKHGNWFFLPWHRVYLYFFEELIRNFSGDNTFALPYWDWSTDHRLPSLFWGGGNSLANPARSGEPGSGRRPGLTPQTEFDLDELNEMVGLNVIENILGQPGQGDFIAFGGARTADPSQRVRQGALEATPHNFIHRWVAGDMGSGGSPYDPIFWLHHCNIDRLWSEWIRRNPTSMPQDQVWLNTMLSDFVDRAGAAAGKKISEVIDSTSLEYQYSDVALPQAVRANALPRRSVASLRAMSAPSTDRQLATLAMASSPDMSNAVADITSGRASAQKNTIRLLINKLRVPKSDDVAIRVFINCQKLSLETDSRDPSYAGTFCFFEPHRARDGAMEGHGNDDGRVSVTLLVTEAFRRLYGTRPLKSDENLKVGLQVRPLFPKDPNAPKTEIIELDPKDVSIEVVAPAQE